MITILPTGLSFGLLLPRRSTRRIIVHHSASPDVAAATIHGWHMQQGWSGIGYHFVIRAAGSVEAGRSLEMIGAHAGPAVNGDRIGICVAGNFMDYAPTAQQIQALIDLVAYLRKKYIDNLEVWRHQDVAATECPGVLFPWPENNWALEAATRGESEGGNTVEPWKNELVTEALGKKLISEDHNPDDPAPKWFVLAVGLRILEEVKSHGEN